jgi:hypothetical protein
METLRWVMVDINVYLKVLADRPKKLNADEVGYQRAPAGSAIRCNNCIHFFRRAVDNFTVCEIFRDEETDTYGVRPDWRCQFQTVDLNVYPLLEETNFDESLAEA